MAKLYIEEYETLAATPLKGQVQAPGTLLAIQQVTISGTSAQSAALNARTRFVVLTTDTTCWFHEAANPTAIAATHRLLPPNTPRGFGVTAGNKIAAITA